MLRSDARAAAMMLRYNGTQFKAHDYQDDRQAMQENEGPHNHPDEKPTLQEDRRLKLFLVLQSFCPLFVLLLIRHVGNFDLIARFFTGLFHGEWAVFDKAIQSPAFGDAAITTLCIIWFLLTAVVARGFSELQASDYDSHSEKIVIESEKKDSGVMFLVTFLLPLLVDDVSTLQGLVSFIVLLAMVVFFLMQSDLFYQNPVLAALGYRVFDFQFVDAYKDVEKDKTYIGMSKGAPPSADDIIKRKYVADDVFLIYSDASAHTEGEAG